MSVIKVHATLVFALVVLTTVVLSLPSGYGDTQRGETLGSQRGYGTFQSPDTYQHHRQSHIPSSYDDYDYINRNNKGYKGYDQNYNAHHRGYGSSGYDQSDYGGNRGYDNGDYGGGEYYRQSGYGH